MALFVRFLAVGLLAALPSWVHAGAQGDRLEHCLVTSSTEADKQALVRWIFFALSRHPEVADLAQIDDERGETLMREAAAVFETLVARRCANESRAAILDEGMAAYQAAFGKLGEEAMGGILSAPDVMKVISGISAYTNEERILKALMQGSTTGKPDAG